MGKSAEIDKKNFRNVSESCHFMTTNRVATAKKSNPWIFAHLTITSPRAFPFPRSHEGLLWWIESLQKPKRPALVLPALP